MTTTEKRPAIADTDLVPPDALLFDGTTSAKQFRDHGESFVRYFLIDRAGLRAQDRVLDVGCGVGQKARALAGYLSAEGSYEGFEIVRDGVAWCNEAYRDYPNFRFVHADIRSSHYNPSGSVTASDYRFPYPDGDFDLVFLSSIFTHMLPRDMRHYLDEIERVVRPGGKTVITYFLLNEESHRHLRRLRDRKGGWDLRTNLVNTPHPYESELCYVADRANPEMIVAHDEPTVRDLYRLHGFEILDVTYGNWCGREHSALQDVLIARKTPQAAT